MAVQALGLPLLLQANDQQLQDLLNGLKVGDSLKGRIVELLAPDKAVVGLRGQNVVAQLPHSDFQKGEILSLQVFQNKPAEAGQAPALTLKLLPPQAAPNPSAWAASMPNLDQAPLPSAATLETALASAQLPQNSLTLSVAQTLASLGVPLEAPALTQAVQAAQSLLNAETALFAPQPAPALAAQVEFQATVRAALDQLQVASQTLPQGEGRLALDQASRHLQNALPASPSLLQAASIVASPVFDAQGSVLAAVPGAPQATVLPGAAQAPAPVALGQWNRALESFVLQPSLQGFEALKLALADLAPKPPLQTAELSLGKVQAPVPATPVAVLPQAAVGTLAPTVIPSPAGPAPQLIQAQASGSSTPAPVAAVLSPATVTAPAPSSPSASAPAQAAATTAGTPSAAALPPLVPATLAPLASSPAPTQEAAPAKSPALAPSLGLELDPAPAKVLVQRETLALLSPALQADNYSPVNFAKALQALSQALEQPQSPASQALLRSVLAQAPSLAPAVVLQGAQALVQDLSLRWSPATPAPAPATAFAAKSLLQELGLPVPRQALSEFSPATVGEAVAWLQARDLPAQRPLVEAVAMWLATGEAVLPKTEAALLQAQELPERVFNANPGLRQAVDQAASAYQASALRPDDPQFTQKLVDWVHSTGLNLEFKAAAQASLNFGQAVSTDPSAQAQESAQGLRPALLKMEHALRTAQAHMQGLQDLPAVQALERAIAPAQQAIQALQAMPMQAQSVPGFDTIHLPLPVWMAGQMGDGRLSVSWRQGRDRELSEKEPVNVAVSLKTESLGEVKVLLQVWKGAAQARVVAQDQMTADFMSQGAEDLKGAFSQRTPFTLQALDFAVAEKAPQGSGAPAAPAAGLSLSA